MKIFLILCIMVITVSNTKAQRNLLNQKYVSLTEDFNIEKDQLEDYRYKGKIETFNEEKHKTKLAKKLFKSKTGKTIVFKSDYYKTKYEIISRQDIKHYRVRYIFINKNKFNTEKAFENYISKVRALLKTTAFKSVAMQYSMDYKKRVGGDSGWFKKGKTHPIFFNEVTNNSRLSEEIFEFEIPEYNGYYFVQKLWSPKDIQEILVMYTIDKK